MKVTRREIVKGAAASSIVAACSPLTIGALASEPATRPIPSSGEALPLVGLGSWVTFNVGIDQTLRDESAAVIAAFFKAGGRLIDSSPMYGSSQPTIGYGLKKLGYPKQLFSAEKVWISDAEQGPSQIEQSRSEWGVEHFDLMQVHNLLSWESHLEYLKEMKANDRVRYIGITTSHGSRHGELERVMKSQPIDFVQLTYNVLDREPEKRLLPLARERGIAVIVNRPFQRGSLLRRVEPHPLPKWASEAGASSWAQFLLKFIISHPAVTCAIPATTQVDHVRENLATANATLPDEGLRKRMAEYVGQL